MKLSQLNEAGKKNVLETSFGLVVYLLNKPTMSLDNTNGGIRYTIKNENYPDMSSKYKDLGNSVSKELKKNTNGVVVYLIENPYMTDVYNEDTLKHTINSVEDYKSLASIYRDSNLKIWGKISDKLDKLKSDNTNPDFSKVLAKMSLEILDKAKE
jgi:DNA-binding phage protein